VILCWPRSAPLRSSSLSRRLQALAHRFRVRPADGPPDQATVLLALPVSRFQVYARVVLMDVDVLARVPAPLQLLPRLGKQRQELPFVVERGHDLMPPLVPQWVVCVPAHHPAIDVIIVRIDLRHCTSIAPLSHFRLGGRGATP
jgi:hypothetical protein